MQAAPTGSSSGSSVYRPAWLWLPAGLGLAALLLEAADLDRAITRWFYDPATGRFPLRHAFLFDVMLHRWAKYVVVAIAAAAIAGAVVAGLSQAYRQHRRLLAFLALGLVLAPAAVSALKLASERPCPWDLADFGGAAQYYPLWGEPPPQAVPGRCFPAGHASAGFSLMAFYFAAIARGRRSHAAAALAIGVTAGAALGLARMAQGAHFLSHTVWSGIVCWYVLLALYTTMLHWRAQPDARLAQCAVR